MTDLQLIQQVVNAGGIAIGLIILYLTCKELLKMVNKMIDIQADLIEKLGETLAEQNQTYYRVRELIEEQRAKDGRSNRQ